MLNIDTDGLFQTLGAIALAIIFVMLGYQKISKEWRSDNIENSIITVMHKELERMSQQNTALSTEIGRLHQQILNLNKQIQELSVENQRLQTEVIALTNEVVEFKASMAMKGKEHATS